MIYIYIKFLTFLSLKIYVAPKAFPFHISIDPQ